MSTLKISQVAIQLYTLRNQCKTIPDLVDTLKKVYDIGYRTVQVSGLGVPYADAKKVLDDQGLAVCATHEPSTDILNNPEVVVERLKTIGTTETAFPSAGSLDFKDKEAIKDLARKLDKAGAFLAKNGCSLSYHNHGIELIPFEDTTVLDYLFKSTDPKNLKAELDTYWVQFGGGDPASWIESVAGRTPLLHIKDYVFTVENKPAFGEIGHGNLNWDRIFAAAEKSGVEWLIVEQDQTPGDPFVSIKKSYDYLKGRLAA